MRLRPFALSAIFLSLPLSTLPLTAQTVHREAPLTSPEERAALHSGPEWDTVAAHLPDPQTATAERLETAADVLRARRFPEDALDYYGYAMSRGGNVSELLNKMGVVRLELRQNDLARAMFQRTVRVQKRNAAAWNNLGVTEYADRNFGRAISAYKKAASIDKKSAVYHSNLGMAYFELRDMNSARKEFSIAVRLDPSIMHGRDGGGGSTAHVLGTQNYGELCFEMGRLYARENKPAEAIEWLSKASESGFDVRGGMRSDSTLSPFLKNPAVMIMLANADGLRARRAVASANAPSLGVAAPADPPKPTN